MFRKVYAIRFDRPAGNGRNKACFLTCMDAAGDRYEAIVKFSAGCESGIGALIREALSAFFAGDLGLHVPEPLLVEVPTEFTAGPSYSEYGTFIASSSKFAFGSTKLAAGYQIISPAQPVSGPMIQKAAEIFVFDTFTANYDRGPQNPNCLTQGDFISIIDHELAFLMGTILFWKSPWLSGGAESLSSVDRHVFWIHIRKQSIDLDKMKYCLEQIDDARLESYIAALPDEWLAGQGNVIANEIVSYIRDLRDNSAEAFNEVVRVLS
ncbi:HipA family kinase [Pseudomonas syringae]|uniref:HipA family kinase n=1 Tax=Pseudomonas syringae TaxID=317 RepID=UPI0034D49D65